MASLTTPRRGRQENGERQLCRGRVRNGSGHRRTEWSSQGSGRVLQCDRCRVWNPLGLHDRGLDVCQLAEQTMVAEGCPFQPATARMTNSQGGNALHGWRSSWRNGVTKGSYSFPSFPRRRYNESIIPWSPRHRARRSVNLTARFEVHFAFRAAETCRQPTKSIQWYGLVRPTPVGSLETNLKLNGTDKLQRLHGLYRDPVRFYPKAGPRVFSPMVLAFFA